MKEGVKGSAIKNNHQDSYFDSAKDWKLQVDLDRQVKVPLSVMRTNLRPDILMTSEKTKRLGIIELTVPGEERIEVLGELKRNKYQGIVEEGKAKRVESESLGSRSRM